MNPPRLSARYASARQLLPFDKERVRRRKARWSRVGQIVAIVVGGFAVCAIVVMLFLLWAVRYEP